MNEITQEQRAIRQANGQMDAIEICARLPEGAVAFAKIVGAWVWIAFDKKPDDETRAGLLELGFRWNPKRTAWQHCGGVKCKRNPNEDPRQKYGEQSLADMLA